MPLSLDSGVASVQQPLLASAEQQEILQKVET